MRDRAARPCWSQAGFTVLDPPEAHLCCGSAGTYNMLQPEIASRLRERKVAALESLAPDVVAAGNIGCIDADRPRQPGPGRPHRRAAGLGDRRA